MAGLRGYRLTIAAGTGRSFNVRGNFVYVRELIDTEAEITISEIEVGEKQGESYTLTLRQDEKWYTAQEYDLVRIQNNTAATFEIELFLGYGDFAKPVPDVVNVALHGSDQLTYQDVDLSAAGLTAILPANPGRTAGIITAHADNADAIRIGDIDTDVDQGTPLQPGETISVGAKGIIYAIEEASTGPNLVCLRDEFNT